MREFEQAAAVLPPELRQQALALPAQERERAEELRLRCGWPMAAVFPEGEVPLSGRKIVTQDLELLLEIASRASVHAVLSQLREGYLTIEGGHRLGLCGTAVLENGQMRNLRSLSSVSIRIARQRPGAALPLLSGLMEGGRLCSTLIAAPPGMGKTTLLRDLVRCISDGDGTPPLRVGLADERGEVAALYGGVPQLRVGRRTDVIEGCPKAQGAMLLLRAMNPQVLAMDEITAPEDVAALLTAAGCGAVLLATAHGEGGELMQRPLYRTMLEERIFQRVVSIQRTEQGRSYTVDAPEPC